MPEHVKALLDAGADAHALAHAGRTALECAALGEDEAATVAIRTLFRG